MNFLIFIFLLISTLIVFLPPRDVRNLPLCFTNFQSWLLTSVFVQLQNLLNIQQCTPATCLRPQVFFVFFFLTSLLEYNCFTMVCYFLLYNKVNQLYIYICSHISSPLHLPPSHPPYPTPLGGHKALSWSPCAMWLLPTSYLFYIW